MRRTSRRLADGREIVYYDSHETPRQAVDQRPLEPTRTDSELRFDPLLDEWVDVTAHRQSRTYHPPPDQCPLCPSREGRPSEIPEPDYEVAVFENRFPSFAGTPAPGETSPPGTPGSGTDRTGGEPPPFASRPGVGRCEVVCFTPDHRASFADLDEPQAALVLAAWTDRTAELSARPGVEQVYCFENRGPEIGVTLGHPHGQIYGYPFITPRTARVLRSVDAHHRRTGGNLFDELVDRERRDGRRVVLDTGHWTAFVPHAARWPYEVHLYPRARVPDLPSLGAGARAELPGVYLELLRRFDRIFGPQAPPTPYISGWHQAPVGEAHRERFALHLELFTIRRTLDKLKYLAGSESGMDAFINDVPPEAAAQRLREVASE